MISSEGAPASGSLNHQLVTPSFTNSMESSIFISEIIGTIHDDEVEVCATADAAYDRSAQKVVVTLAALARRITAHGHGELVPEPWMPVGEKVTEHLPIEEVDSFAKDVFHSWVKKVRASVPATSRLHA